ncbi:MAG: hypothetical protein JOZ47_23400 [Kutzneria sp.]|nr:hypothetical protein [Kutzneria sp.]MBV9847988.1 hypothetical protein [Kutzneria sp.]
MAVTVYLTRCAAGQRDDLRSKQRACYEEWLARLRGDGCEAMDYRLTGEVVDHLCVSHLRDTLRVVVAFQTAARATVLLIGPHLGDEPDVNVYDQLYELAGIPRPTTKRAKPSCCDPGGLPPDWTPELEDLVIRAEKLARPRRGRRSGPTPTVRPASYGWNP